MLKQPDWLNNPEHIPTLDELRALFHNGNDFSAMSVMDMDYEILPPEAVETLEYN
ncbi:MAG: hypothetical protein NC452_18795 [Eubacterium sp.]|nr:hypothetical protein [Eubacterium sp.]